MYSLIFWHKIYYILIEKNYLSDYFETEPMNILLAAAEAAPFAKAGGLADMTQSFPFEWKKAGHNPITIIPKYGNIDIYKFGFQPTGLILNVPMGYWTEYGHLWSGFFPGTDVPVYLIENADYFNRIGIYGNPDEFWDNDRRFIFFSRAVFEASKALNFKPDIIHAHDYHTAFTMAFLKSQYRFDSLFYETAGVFTIHNLAYQGKFDAARAMEYSTFGMSQFYPGSWFEKDGAVNAMKTGIMFADKITTVSPSYAQEIRTPFFSEGMQSELNYRAADLVGVLNGVYYDEWSPENDSFIYEKFDVNTLSIKHSNKIKFLLEHGVNESDNLDLPLIGMVSRLAEQKGIDLLINNLEEHLAKNRYRFALLGTGESRYVDFFNYLAWKYPGRALIHIGYDNALSHKIIGSSDFFIVPSRFEPCGLTQMYALRFGTIPIVRSTGGLADTVFEYRYYTFEGNGYTFWHYNSDDYSFALNRALDVFNNQPHWDNIRRNAMLADYSSTKSSHEYIKVFNWALGKVRS